MMESLGSLVFFLFSSSGVARMVVLISIHVPVVVLAGLTATVAMFVLFDNLVYCSVSFSCWKFEVACMNWPARIFGL